MTPLTVASARRIGRGRFEREIYDSSDDTRHLLEQDSLRAVVQCQAELPHGVLFVSQCRGVLENSMLRMQTPATQRRFSEAKRV